MNYRRIFAMLLMAAALCVAFMLITPQKTKSNTDQHSSDNLDYLEEYETTCQQELEAYILTQQKNSLFMWEYE